MITAATQECAAVWLNRLADELVNDDGDAVERLRELPPDVARALVETLGSFLSCVADDVSFTKDAADFGRRVAQTLTGLVGNVARDLDISVPGNGPWDFAQEIAP